MNALICLKSALRERSGFIVNGLFTVAAVAWLGSCADQLAPSRAAGAYDARGRHVESWADEPSTWKATPTAPLASAPATPRAADGVRAEEAFAKPAKERPGLATQWGGAIKSPLGETRFTRATVKPYGVDAIGYNDSEGLKAMGVKNMRVDGMQQAAGGILEWGVRGRFGMLSAWKSYGDQRRYVEGRNGGGYSIVVKNRCKSRIQVVLSVDGLDVLDGKPAATSRPGYVIGAGETLEVKGFRTSQEAVAAFKFSTVGESYAETRHGDTRNVGVIGLAAYLEKGRDPWTWMPEEVRQRETASPFATAR